MQPVDEIKTTTETNLNTNTNTNNVETTTTTTRNNTIRVDVRYDKLLTRVARLCVLSTTIAVSSLVFLGVVGIYTANSAVNALLWITMSIDSSINVFCLILYFDFAVPLYNRLCGKCCKTKCVATVLPMCLCCYK